MKMAIFSWEYPPFLVGGLGVYSFNISKKFVEKGNEVFVFTLNYNSKEFEEENGVKIYRQKFPDVSKLFQFFANEDLRRWGSNIKLFTDVFNYNLFSAKKFFEILKKEEFEIVAIHDWLSAFSGLILRNEIPIVFHLHSVEEQRNPFGSEILKNLEKEMGKKANRIITVSNSMKEFLISIGYDREKISVCYNGCDPEVYNPKKVNFELVEKLRKDYKLENKNVIFFIGRLVWFKGIFNLVQAMPSVLKEFPETKLITVGIGENEKLISLINQLRLEDRIIVKSKWLSEEEKVAHYALADLCVFPSISEPFGIVASEAMAMEKPVVVGAAGISGLREQVIPSGEKRTGVHVNGSSPEDIAWGIKEVLKNPEEAKRWGKNGRERVLKEFTWDIVAEKTLAIYEELIR